MAWPTGIWFHVQPRQTKYQIWKVCSWPTSWLDGLDWTETLFLFHFSSLQKGLHTFCSFTAILLLMLCHFVKQLINVLSSNTHVSENRVPATLLEDSEQPSVKDPLSISHYFMDVGTTCSERSNWDIKEERTPESWPVGSFNGWVCLASSLIPPSSMEISTNPHSTQRLCHRTGLHCPSHPISLICPQWFAGWQPSLYSALAVNISPVSLVSLFKPDSSNHQLLPACLSPKPRSLTALLAQFFQPVSTEMEEDDYKLNFSHFSHPPRH